MKIFSLILTFFMILSAYADTPPPGTVKAKLYSGDGLTSITATSGALDVNVVNSGGSSTVNQGNAGVQSWLASITSSALPTNACQESGGHLASIDSKLTSPLAVTGNFYQATQPVSLLSLPSLAAGSNTIGNVNVNGTVPVSGTFWQATQPVSGTVTANAGSGTFLVDGSAHTQPVSGTFWQATQPVSVATLPPLAAGSNTIGNVNINGTVPVSGSITATNSANGTPGATAPSDATQTGGVDGTGKLQAFKVSSTGVLSVDGSAVTQPISAASLPLPAGAATSALQTTANTSLSSIDSKLTSPLTVTGPLTDTQLRASAVPVSAASLPLPVGAATESTLSAVNTTLGALTNGSQKSQLIDASGNVNTMKQLNNQVVATDYGIITNSVIHGLTTGGGGGYVDVKVNPSGALAVDGSGVTQPVSGTVTANIGTTNGLALDSSVTGLQVSQGSTTSGQKGTLIQGAVTTSAPSYINAQSSPLSLTTSGGLRVDGSGTTQPVSGTVTANAGSGTFAVSAASLPLPAGAATESTLSSINTKTPSLGAATTANSSPVNIASDQVVGTSMPDQYVTGQAAQTATVNNILTTTAGAAATDASGYKSATVQVVSTGTAGTFIFEGSNDNVNFQTIPVYSQLILTGTPITAAITATASQLIYTFPVSVRYIRLRIATTITGGSIQAFTRLTQAAWTPAIFQVAQATAGNLNTTATIASGTVTTVSTVTASNTAIPGIIADVASAAITTTATTGTLTPTFGSAYIVSIPVTVVSGTNPTMDIQVQESDDTGTNWTAVYDFPRITTTGIYRSRPLLFTGNRIRYVQTIGGTTPSFTRAINRLQASVSSPVYRQIIDRTIVPTTTNSTTPTLFCDGAGYQTMVVNQGSGGSPVTFAIDGSVDGTNYVLGIATVAGVVGGATPVSAQASGVNYKFIRGRVVTGVASTTISDLTLMCSNDSKLPVVSGAVPVSGSITATNTANGNTGSAVPAQATQVAGSDGTNLRALKVSSTGVLSVDGSAVTQPVSGSVTVTQATGTNLHTVIDSGTVNTTPVGGSSASQTTGTVSTVITLTAPSNAQGFILQNLQTSTANIRFAMGATATTTNGMQLAPGQDSGFIPAGVNISVVAESGTQNYNVQWVVK